MKVRKLRLTKDFKEAERKNTKIFIFLPTVSYVKSFFEGVTYDYWKYSLRFLWLRYELILNLRFKLVDKMNRKVI